MTTACDILVIGAGMAGSSAAAELASRTDSKVTVLEAEAQPGYHSSGRSAATYIASYGNLLVRKLTRVSRPLLAELPADAERSVLTPRGCLHLARPGCEPLLEDLLNDPGVEEITVAEAARQVPVLRAEAVSRAAREPSVNDIDAHGLLHGYLRTLKRHGGRLVCNARVERLSHSAGCWQAATAAGAFAAPLLINAAGAWADAVARLAGLAPLGLTPTRRTVAIIPVPDGAEVGGWPMVCDAEENLYFKPEAGKLLVSPEDETPTEPGDAQPEDLDLAYGIARLEKLVTFSVGRVEHRWAGLRTFAPDRRMVVGFDPTADGFFWLAGQGGYGIQTAPAMALLAAALAQGCGDAELPAALRAAAITAAEVSPARLRTG